MRMRWSGAAVLMGALALGACSLRLGGPKPEEYTAVAFRAANEDAAATAARLQPSDPQLVLLAADRDSAWFAAVAQHLELKLSGPARTGPSGLAFLTPMTPLGDTAHVLNVPGGGKIHMQDALFEIDKERHLDLMLVQFDAATEIRAGVRSLLEYYATDVGGTAAVVLGVETPTAAAADSVALLLRSAFGNIQDCGERGSQGVAPSGTLRLYYGPQARIDCERARSTGNPPIITTRVVVGG